jgi:hypothetical protein
MRQSGYSEEYRISFRMRSIPAQTRLVEGNARQFSSGQRPDQTLPTDGSPSDSLLTTMMVQKFGRLWNQWK